ncbi:hypothetical protein HUN39_17925 [Methylocystis sp. FS]|uniref:hypothetical protein n=1 Tax=Methylocystis TaxID=133 RepID=UPI0015840423|nr:MULTISPECIES: hypothetical protein [Methylocystis]MBG0799987.1 hypothetical protein [Methylocystis sp. H4A]NUJ81866.1 hypothetical protein [Methylocystis silviterrae]
MADLRGGQALRVRHVRIANLRNQLPHPQKGGLETERTAGAAIVGMKIEPCIYQEQTGLGAYLQLGASLSSGNVGY